MPWSDHGYMPPYAPLEHQQKDSQFSNRNSNSAIPKARTEVPGFVTMLYSGQVDFEHKVRAHMESLYGLSESSASWLMRDNVNFANPPPLTEASERTKAPLFAVYNHKGGVGKSTCCLSMAGALAAQGFKVGLVDADNQGNSTKYLLRGQSVDATPVGAFQGQEQDTVVEMEGIDSDTESDDDQTQDGYVFPHLVEGWEKGYTPTANEVPDERDATHVECNYLHQVLQKMNISLGFEHCQPGELQDLFRMKKCSFCPSLIGRNGGEIYLLGGGPEIQETADQLYEHINSTINGRGRYIGGFRYMLHGLAEANGLDIVLVDLGPANTRFNRWVISSCDFIVPPTSPTWFGVDAARTMLNDVLPRVWTEQKNFLVDSMRRTAAYFNSDEFEIRQKYAFNPITRVLPFAIARFSIQGIPHQDLQGRKVLEITQSAAIRAISNEYKTMIDSIGRNWATSFFVSPDTSVNFLLPEMSKLINIGEGSGVPLTLLKSYHLTGRRNTQSWEHLNQIRFLFALYSKAIAELGGVQEPREPPLPCTPHEISLVHKLIFTTAQGIANELMDVPMRESELQVLLQTRLESAFSASEEGNCAIVSVAVKSDHSGRDKEADLVVWSKGVRDISPFIVILKRTKRIELGTTKYEILRRQLKQYEYFAVLQTSRAHESLGRMMPSPQLHIWRPQISVLNFVPHSEAGAERIQYGLYQTHTVEEMQHLHNPNLYAGNWEGEVVNLPIDGIHPFHD